MINKNTDSEHVKFISYTGKYPNLCSGILTLEIDGRTIRFGSRYVDSTVDYPKFWESGGSCSFDNNWNSNVTDGEWQIDFNEIPDCLRKKVVRYFGSCACVWYWEMHSAIVI